MNVDPLLKPFESLLNRNIAASTPARQALAGLAGRAFAIEIATPIEGRPLRIRLAADETGVRVTGGGEPADATISGTPFALAALIGGRSEGRLAGASVRIVGDAEVAGAFEKLLKHARPDLEEELARLVGDVPAHQVARAARGVVAWGKMAADSFARNVGEFLTEESRDVPPRAELEHFLAGVDRVREDADRAEARLRLLEERLFGNDAAGKR